MAGLGVSPDNSQSAFPRTEAVSLSSPVETHHCDKEKSPCGFNAALSLHLTEWPLIFLVNHTPLNQRILGSSPSAPTKPFKDLAQLWRRTDLSVGRSVGSFSSVSVLIGVADLPDGWRYGYALPQLLFRSRG